MRPKNENAERIALGAAMLERSAAGLLIERCGADHFDVPKNREVFRALKAIYDSENSVDVVTVYDELSRQKSALSALDIFGYTENVHVSEIESAVQSLEDAYVYRNIYILAGELNTSVKNITDKPLDVLEAAQQKIFDLLNSYSKSNLLHVKTGLEKYLEMAEWAHHNKGKILGIETKYKKLDNSLNGLLKTRFTVLAARPSMGKSALAVCIARNVAEQGIPVAFFSLEMSMLQIQERLVAIGAPINTQDVRSGKTNDEDFKSIGEALNKINGLPLYVDDSAGQTVEEIIAKARRARENYGIELVIIDHMHIVDSNRKFYSRNDQLGYISRKLKGCAKENDNHVLALAQLNRGVETRKGADQIPGNADLRESGNIEQDADNILFIHRWEYYQKDLEDKKKLIPDVEPPTSSIGKALLRIEKARDNPAPVNVMLEWKAAFTLFENEKEISTKHTDDDAPPEKPFYHYNREPEYLEQDEIKF